MQPSQVKIRAIGIDDEPSALLVLASLVQKIPFMEWVGGFERTTEALEFLHVHSVDVVFLDIQMPDMSGLEVAKLMGSLSVSIIFTTAHSEHALAGYALGVLDYLVKPLELSKLWAACQRAWDQANKKHERPASLFVKDGHDWVRVMLAEVLYIQSDANLLFVQEETRKIVTRMTLQDMMQLLPSNQFIRIHKSFIIGLSHVHKLERHQVSVGKFTVPIAPRYKENLELALLRS